MKAAASTCAPLPLYGVSTTSRTRLRACVAVEAPDTTPAAVEVPRLVMVDEVQGRVPRRGVPPGALAPRGPSRGHVVCAASYRDFGRQNLEASSYPRASAFRRSAPPPWTLTGKGFRPFHG